MNEVKKGTVALKLLEMIERKTARIGIIGLGYVGLPLAIHFGEKGFHVIGFDLDSRKIDKILHGESYIKHIPADQIKKMTDSKQFDVTIDFSRLSEADCILICVPTPLSDKMEPDLSYLLQTTETIANTLRRGQLIVLESTTYPGTTEEMLLPRLSSSDMKVGQDFFLAFSPEREDPGNKKFTATNIPKVVGGVTSDCLETATALYNSITRSVPVSSTQAAELTKL
ncbi:MAG: nucleotide sugar dehydrogenase, partial [Desulfobacterales bacterium]